MILFSTQAEGENEVNNELANRMSLFYAEATPMLKTLSDATTKFVSEVSVAWTVSYSLCCSSSCLQPWWPLQALWCCHLCARMRWVLSLPRGPHVHIYLPWAASLWLHSQHVSAVVAKPKSWVFSPNPALSPVFSVCINNTTVKAGNLEVIILNSFLYLTSYISSVRQCYWLSLQNRLWFWKLSPSLTLPLQIGPPLSHLIPGWLHLCSYWSYFCSCPTIVLSPKSSQVIFFLKTTCPSSSA